MRHLKPESPLPHVWLESSELEIRAILVFAGQSNKSLDVRIGSVIGVIANLYEITGLADQILTKDQKYSE